MTTTERIQVLKKAIEALWQDYSVAMSRRGGAYNREFHCPQIAVVIREEIEVLNWDLSQLQKLKRRHFISDMRDALDALEAGDYITDTVATISLLTQSLENAESN